MSGFWHGANFTFIIWGLLHAVFYLPLVLTNKNRINVGVVAVNNSLPNVKELFQMLSTFLLVSFAWIFFRAESLTVAFEYIKLIFTWNGFSIIGLTTMLPLIIIMFFVEWVGRRGENPFYTFIQKFNWFKYPAYLLLFIWVYANFSKENSFIYFQF